MGGPTQQKTAAAPDRLQRRPLASISPAVIPLVASASAWLLLFILFPPGRQDFPLNDDWAFAKGVFRFAHGDGIDYVGWASMPQLGQWLWACPFVWLFGATHTTLRLTTIILSWFGLWAVYDLLRQERVKPFPAALATGTLAFTPLFFLLQGTFMTDVPALSLALVALALYVRAIRGGCVGWLTGACIVAGLAAISRQNTLAVPVVAAVMLAREPSLRRKAGWWLGVAVPVVMGGIIHLWFQSRSDVRSLKPAAPPPAALLFLPFIAVHFCALSALPLLVRRRAGASWRNLIWPFGITLVAAGYWLLFGVYLPYGGLFPYSGNMISPWGAFAGSKFTGHFVVGTAEGRPLLLGTFSGVLFSLLGCAAGAVLIDRIRPFWRNETFRSPLLLFTMFQIPFILVVPDFYDRYLLFLLPGALVVASAGLPQLEAPRRPVAELGVLTLLAVISLGLMHDWLAWNSARWALGRRAIEKKGIDRWHIEGGVEWDGWYAGLGEPANPARQERWPVLPFTREWFTRIQGQYALSFSVLKGARPVDAEPYTLWLFPGTREFYLIELPPRATSVSVPKVVGQKSQEVPLTAKP
jgi:4-amino-4-deoxy-L-arabinose transferase-like glycosyltransferase